MKKYCLSLFISTFIFAFSFSAQASSFHCKINLNQFDDLEPAISDEEEQTAQSTLDHPILFGQISKIDTTMPQTFISEYVLKDVHYLGKKLFRATPEKVWNQGAAGKKIAFNLSHILGSSDQIKIAFPENVHELKSKEFFPGLLQELEEGSNPDTVQCMPLDCWID